MSQSLLNGVSMSKTPSAGAVPVRHSIFQCRLLQNAANSVLGQEVITYAKHLGIKTINVVRPQRLCHQAQAEGVPHLLAIRSSDSSHSPSSLNCI